jgi:anti-sigma regulatory factor (Ser/Thr protein kinase)
MAVRRKLAGMQPRGAVPGADAGDQARGSVGGAIRPLAGLHRPESAHVAFFYNSADEYAQVTGEFVRAGLDAGKPVMVAVPAANAGIIKSYLGRDAARAVFEEMTVFADMTVLGRNPARIIPAISAFAETHPGQLVHYVGEPAWPSRTASERAEVMRHEKLLNLAFGSERIRILCPYHATGVGPEVLAQAAGTHPMLMRNGRLEHSTAFSAPDLAQGVTSPLSSPPASAPALTYRDDPGAARQFARQQAQACGLPEPRLTDLVIAVGELAANTLRHTRAEGTVRVWVDGSEVICEVRDHGHIRDPLTGRRRPPADAASGHGLWVVHQVCDLVEMRSGSSGTVFRLHLALRS